MNANVLSIQNFVRDWKNRDGYEKGEAQPFWLAFIRDVFDIRNPEKFINFETQVKIDNNTHFLDGYLFDSRVIIEQKNSHTKLDDEVFQQAVRYNDALNFGRKARWIVTSNFKEFKIYDMQTHAAPVSILLDELPDRYSEFEFLIKRTRRTTDFDRDLNFEAGAIIKNLYENLEEPYKVDKNPALFQNLNKLCVRLVFCFYAEAAGIFPERKMFTEYMKKSDGDADNFRRALEEVFEFLNTPVDKRRPHIKKSKLVKLPYIDGGLFNEKRYAVPEFQRKALDIFFENLARLKWQDIDPTIFGAVFESTLKIFNEESNTRSTDGVHYTAPENIHKVINALFIDDLYDKFQNAESVQDYLNLQDEIANIKILDPACGSGNFLTESYIVLRELENEIIQKLFESGYKLPENPIKISIENFFGIEINDFAVAVAKTALWISEIKMRQKLNKALNLNLQHFPLKKIPHIICENALTFDWQELVKPADLNFIAGNPPFVGHQWRTAEQMADMKIAFYDLEKYGKLDYVCAWFNKASDFIAGTNIRCAFVATNSICQGESVGILWKHIFSKNVHIDFAYKTFKWFSESTDMAQVHVVIIGFSQVEGLQKKIYTAEFVRDDDGNFKLDEEGKKVEKIEYTPAQNINGYLLDAPNIYIENRGNPLNKNLPKMSKGSQPTDGGNLIIKDEEYEEFIEKEPLAKKYIRPYIGAEEFINGKRRYCLWLVDCPKNELEKMKLVNKKLKAVKEFRLTSKTASVRRDAETPSLFTQIRQPETNYLTIPRFSSENRKYIPIGFMTPDIIVSDTILTVPNADIFIFGVLTSGVHMAWMRVVCGRLEMRYGYSPSVYNNFVWCKPTEEQRVKIESTAQKILDVRAGYPEKSLAELYSEITMPEDLRQVHAENDAAVMAAYGFGAEMTEAEIVSALMEKYLQLTK